MADDDLFPGFETHRIAGPAGTIHVRTGGSGAPLLCLHGYPQTMACWHRLAPGLATRAHVVLMDLRGYGASDAPPGDEGHVTYSKREMAKDCLAVMKALGYSRFSVMGYDRGGRVAYRLALDHPDAVDRLIVLDILPTVEVWSRLTAPAAVSAYHWSFLAQPKPMPETLISGAPLLYADHTLRGWTKGKSLEAFDPRALAAYRALLTDPARVHAVCEDYRAGWSVDRVIDEADKAAGRRIAAPTLALWGSDYVGKGAAGPLDIWRAWCNSVTGQAIDSGHFLAEENPKDTFAAVGGFLGT
jgi:haloacetate dehalogenase